MNSRQKAMVVSQLRVEYAIPSSKPMVAVRGVSWELTPGVILGLAGESGSGKSTAMLASIGYRELGTTVQADEVLLGDRRPLIETRAELQTLWGKEVAYVAQNAALAMNPTLTLRQHFKDLFRVHKEPWVERQVEELLEEVQITDPQAALGKYPHQFSGGQQQRIALGLALALSPKLLLLDEPTTGLDVTTQAQITALIRRIVHERHMAVMYVSHDLPLLNAVTDEIKIMRFGEIVEEGKTADVLSAPVHEYAKALISSVPDITGQIRHREGLHSTGVDAEPLLQVEGLNVSYGKSDVVHSVDFELKPKEFLCIVGESGSGKSTIAKAIAGVSEGNATGRVALEGEPLMPNVQRRSKAAQKAVQIIFQNPKTALNPRHTVLEMLYRVVQRFRTEVKNRKARREIVIKTLEEVGLGIEVLHRFSSQLSGGEAQRVAVARGLIARPKVLICDEVTSALDVSVQDQILKLLADLAESNDMSVLFITHDLRVVRSIADRIIVLQDGRVQEEGRVSKIFEAPEDPYTKRLLQAVSPMPVLRARNTILI